MTAGVFDQGLVIELEAERCSLDSLGAFTDEPYCGPAVARSMHSGDTHSQMWVGSDTELTFVVLFIHRARDPERQESKLVVVRSHSL